MAEIKDLTSTIGIAAAARSSSRAKSLSRTRPDKGVEGKDERWGTKAMTQVRPAAASYTMVSTQL